MDPKFYTAADVAHHIAMCRQADIEPSEDGMVETECQTLRGEEADRVEAAVRIAWAAYIETKRD